MSASFYFRGFLVLVLRVQNTAIDQQTSYSVKVAYLRGSYKCSFVMKTTPFLYLWVAQGSGKSSVNDCRRAPGAKDCQVKLGILLAVQSCDQDIVARIPKGFALAKR